MEPIIFRLTTKVVQLLNNHGWNPWLERTMIDPTTPKGVELVNPNQNLTAPHKNCFSLSE